MASSRSLGGTLFFELVVHHAGPPGFLLFAMDSGRYVLGNKRPPIGPNPLATRLPVAHDVETVVEVVPVAVLTKGVHGVAHRI